MNILESQNLKKHYTIGESVIKAVDGITLQVKEGDFASIMGASGSGKSTFLYLLGALEPQTSGEVLFKGEKLDLKNDRQSSNYRRKSIGFVFQNYNLIPNFTVKENVILPILLDGGSVRDKEKKASELIEKVGLTGKENQLASKLSGGQQQRIAIARALINDPEIILADEPIGSLDSKNGKEIMELLRKINREGKTIVQVTHSTEAAQYGNKLIIIKDGELKSTELV